MPPLCHYWRPFQALPTRHSVARKTPASTQHFCSVSDLFFWCLYINTVYSWARRKRSCIQNSRRVTCIGWGLLILDAETGSYLAYEDGGMSSHD